MNLDNMGYRIYELRTGKKMSQISLGMKLGVTQETISAYENQKAFPSAANILQICEIFSVSADYLFGLTNDKNYVSYSDLNSSEAFLVKRYRNLSVKDKMTVECLINCLTKLDKID
ncbi:MAG: helix-turn-helix domain-containing protein [Ruminococcus flavefaciens]|nr:helix-turn-helix domain-containing protein [Ruminococcus flavefaciens]MCM1440380.1 helix-turn-helix domain-containing protein [Roseburia sp.]